MQENNNKQNNKANVWICSRHHYQIYTHLFFSLKAYMLVNSSEVRYSVFVPS